MEGEERAAYQIRQYRPEDRAGVLELDSLVWDRDRGHEWFDWKYESNPYIDHTPVFVVRNGQEVVGARPFMAFEMRTGDRTVTALQPSDTMVHPDHRRRGLFTRMTERAIEFYEDSDVAFFFNFPNRASLGGYEKLGWRTIEGKRTFYRVQNPDAFVPRYTNGGTSKVLGLVLNPLVKGYNDLQRPEESTASDVTTETVTGVDVETLSTLYERRPPDRLHAERTPEFYEWRFSSPVWSRSTYVARVDDEPVAAMIARRRRTNDAVTVSQIVEVVPMTGGERWHEAISALLERTLDDHVSSDLIAIAGSVVPSDLLTDYGFHADDRLPLSKLSGHRCTLAARPVGDDSWTVDDYRLDQPSNWLLTYAERDTT